MQREVGQKISFSTDVGGILGDGESVTNLVNQAGWKDVGIEVVGMFTQSKHLYEVSQGMRRPRFRIDGIHNRLGATESPFDHDKGPMDWLLIKVADLLMRGVYDEPVLYRDMLRPNSAIDLATSVDMIASNTSIPVYFNVHNREVANRLTTYNNIVVPIFHSGHLTIENGPCRGDIRETKKLVYKLRKDHRSDKEPRFSIENEKLKRYIVPVERKVSGTFDFAHALVEYEHGGMPDMKAFTRHWKRMLKDFELSIFEHVHIPIGLNLKDSLPMLELINEQYMLRDLIAKMIGGGVHITFENQHNLLFGAWNTHAEVDRLKRVRDGMLQAGLPEYYS